MLPSHRFILFCFLGHSVEDMYAGFAGHNTSSLYALAAAGLVGSVFCMTVLGLADSWGAPILCATYLCPPVVVSRFRIVSASSPALSRLLLTPPPPRKTPRKPSHTLAPAPYVWGVPHTDLLGLDASMDSGPSSSSFVTHHMEEAGNRCFYSDGPDTYAWPLVGAVYPLKGRFRNPHSGHQYVPSGYCQGGPLSASFLRPLRRSAHSTLPVISVGRQHPPCRRWVRDALRLLVQLVTCLGRRRATALHTVLTDGQLHPALALALQGAVSSPERGLRPWLQDWHPRGSLAWACLAAIGM